LLTHITTMSDLFNNYDQEFIRLSQTITRQIAEIPTLHGDRKINALTSAQKNVDEAHEVLTQMALEISSLPSIATKKDLQNKYKQYDNDFKKMQKDLKVSRTALPKDGGRDQLIGNSSLGGDLTAVGSGQDRDKLLSGTDKLQDTSSKIKQAQMTIISTQEVGAGIMQNLDTQTDTLQHTRDNLTNADTFLNNTRRLLSGMGRRAQTNKLILACIILVLLTAIGLILYFSFSGSSTPQPSPSSQQFL